MLRRWIQRSHARGVVALGAMTTLSLLAVVACDSSDDRATFDPDTAPDAGLGPNLPPPAPETDGGLDASFDTSAEPVVCEVSPCVVELAAGANHVCARLSTGEVSCWGENTFGAVGNGAPGADPGAGEGGGKDPGKGDGPVGPEDVTTPVRVTDVSEVTQISAGYRTTCARRADGAVLCWGGNEWGQLGLPSSVAASDSDQHAYRNRVELGASATRVDVGQRTACAVRASGELACWGFNDRKQLARPDDDIVLGPGTSDLAGFVVTRAAGSNSSSYGVTNVGGLLSWGALAGREGSLNPDPVPAPIPLNDVHEIAAAPTHACAIAGGRVYCWGSSQTYALCTGLPSAERLPAHAMLQTKAFPQQLSVSMNSTCVRLTDGTIQCCGAAGHGQLAVTPPDGGSPVEMSFTRAENFKGYAVQVVTTDIATCALLKSGAVECWGGNKHGELGRGTTDDDAHPIPAVVSFQ